MTPPARRSWTFSGIVARRFGLNPLGRPLRDAKPCEIGAGASEIRRRPVGREMMGEDS